MNTNKKKGEPYRKCESILIEDSQNIELEGRSQTSTPRISIEREIGQFSGNSARDQQQKKVVQSGKPIYKCQNCESEYVYKKRFDKHILNCN